MLKNVCVGFGLVFLAVGLLGFVPGVTRDGHLLGIFHVNAVHNVVHILSGLAALMAGWASEHAARMFLRLFGAVYAIIALLGFVYGDRPIFGLIANNAADTWLHLAIAIASLLLGFALKERIEPRLRERTT